jgi:hypothetical protein
MTQQVAAPASGSDRAGAKPENPSRSPDALPQSPRPAPDEKRWYRLPLAAAYAVPFIVAGATLLLVSDQAPRETSEGLFTAALVSLALPPIVRVVYDDAAGIPLEVLGTLGFVAGGGVIGLLYGVETCEGDECIGAPIVTAAVGLVAGYAAWAIVDTAFFAYASPAADRTAAGARRDASARASVTPWLMPLLKTGASPRAAETARDRVSLDGLAVGVALRF